MGLRTHASGRRPARPLISSSTRTDRACFPSRARLTDSSKRHIDGLSCARSLLVPARWRSPAARPGVAVSARRPAWSFARRRSAAVSPGLIAAGRASAAAGQVVYELHVGTFTPEGTWAAAAEQLPALADLGVTVVEMMPIADFAGRVRVGLRRRQPLCADAPVWHARRSPPLRRSRARRRPRRDPGRRLQPSRTGRQLSERVLARLLHRQVQQRLGPRDQLRGPARRRARSSSRTPATGSTSSISTGSVSTRRRTCTTRRRSTSSRRSSQRARRGRPARADHDRRRERAAGHSIWSGRRSRAAMGRCALER